ncbi:MAG: hypothetical protein ACE145_13015 [Terriglobia bacterium]
MAGRVKIGWTVAALLLAGILSAREELPRPQFKYAAGTESLSQGCQGNLEIGVDGLTFKCLGGSVSAPYASISLMQYRSDVSNKVRKMKVKWTIRPDYVTPLLGGKRNRFFTVVFRAGGATHVMVLRVQPEAMRPYLAEIDLKAQRRVEVESYEEY